MNPGPAGIPQLEYIFSRVVCTSVPIGYIALLVILIIAGIKYLTSGGEPKAISQAHQTVTWGLLGIVFLAISWLILQLIQNFTGVEVTKFTLASLPGVEGLTSSCWADAPVAQVQESTNVQESCKQLKSEAGYPVYICLLSCDDPYKYMQPFDATHRLGFINSDRNLVTYVENPFSKGIPITEPRTARLLAGSIDNSIWGLTDLGKEVLVEESNKLLPKQSYFRRSVEVTSNIGAYSAYKNGLWLFAWGSFELPQYNGDDYSKFPKEYVPTDLIESLVGASLSVRAFLYLEQPDFDRVDSPYKKAGRELTKDIDFKRLDLIGFSCPDADFYPVLTMLSPLIYLYPSRQTEVSLKIHSPIASKVKQNNLGYWNVTALPSGLLRSSDNQELTLISYEFLRRDFKRPVNGVVVNEENLITYLKDNLWKNLGLTNQEIEDYWNDLKGRIPSSTYYFISLIDRSEIDRVLPMEINPKPDTIIRNMTYILPLSSPFIPTPLLNEQPKAPQRNGFTVLENGGFIDGF